VGSLVERGVPAFVRYSRGRDVMAASGSWRFCRCDGAPCQWSVLSEEAEQDPGILWT